MMVWVGWGWWLGCERFAVTSVFPGIDQEEPDDDEWGVGQGGVNGC